jgi:hypothetical protein
MKTRFAVAAVIAMVGLFHPDAWGFLSPKSEPFTNYDKRIELLKQSPAKQASAATLGPAQDQAVTALQSAIPDLRISKDRILGTPANVAAARGFLTGPGGKGKGLSETSLQAVDANDPHRVIKAFLNEHSALFGHDSSILVSTKVQRDYVTEHNGLHTTIWQQTLDDIPVFEALLTGHVTRDDELVSISSHMVPDAASAADAGTPGRRSLQASPTISAAKAISIAAANVGAEVAETGLTPAQLPQGAQKTQDYTAGNLVGPTHAELVWLPMDRTAMRLCWEVRLITQVPADGYVFLVDAETGEVLIRRLTTLHITPATYNVYTNDSPSPLSPSLVTPGSTQPTNVSRSLVTLSALDTNASLAGWVAEGPSPRTTGNNAEAFLDRDFNGLPDGPLPQATTNRIFDFPLNLNQQPTSYQNASTVQLFYRANWYHDRLYQLGFTEAAGNYQVTNFARGGLENDPVLCLVQAGADVGLSDNSFFIPAPDGSSGYCAMFVFTGPLPQRDGSLDSEVVCHELTHGTSERLVGGGVGISQLQSSGMGEGWSDFYALCLLSESTDNVNSNYAMGGYVTYQLAGTGFTENYYYGIRRYPYTTDLSKNPLTFKDIDPAQASPHNGVPLSGLFSPFDPFGADEVHNQGEVWCVTLREVWANLVTKLGWDAGNQLTLQLVTDGMKLAPANPTFLEARDAIIQADQVDTIGDNYPELWQAFAKRGMGFSATSPTSDTTAGVHEAFDLPTDLIPDGILEVRVVPPSGEIFFKGETNSIFIRVSDGLGITNATITATTDSGTNVLFRNDGVAPDVRANNDIYSAFLNVPTNQNSMTITMVISAPGKTTSSNSVTYFIISPPPNDYFTNSIKVAAAGASYFTSNKRATMEAGEPLHGGIASVGASLWWSYTPSVNTNVLIDSGGSNIRGILAVYTNNAITNLGAVISAVGRAGRLGPFVQFNAKAGNTYHVAMASFSTNNVGVINLNFAPGGQVDTNPPDVSITAPLNGLLVTTNRIAVAATVTDPSPNPSGIRSVSVIVSASAGQGNPMPMMPPGSSSLLGPISTNWSSLVALQPGQNTIQVFATDFSGNQSTPVSVQVTYRVPGPANDFFVNAIALTTNSGVVTANTVAATKEAGEPNHAGSFGGHSVWWTYTPPVDGVLSLSTSNSTFDTVLAVYQGASVSTLTPIASNDDAFPGAPGGFSQIIQAVRSNQTYRIAVDGFDGQSGIATLSYSFATGTVYHVTINSTAGGFVTPTSADVQSNGTLIVTATPNPYFQFDSWDGAVASSDNPLSVVVNSNLSLTAHFVGVVFTDDFESGGLQHIAWITNGPAVGAKPWFVQTNVVAAGQFAARSGFITDNQTSSLLFTGTFRDGNGSFDYRVSSELNFDTLKFLVDGVQQQQWSGDVPWANFALPLTAGTHTLEWRYSKDASGSSGLDAAFIDNVNLPLGLVIDSTSAAHLHIALQNNGTFLINLLGQTNQQYVLQVSTNLFSSWQNLSTNIATNGVIQYIEPVAGSNAARFYRAVVLPP